MQDRELDPSLNIPLQNSLEIIDNLDKQILTNLHKKLKLKSYSDGNQNEVLELIKEYEANLISLEKSSFDL